MPLSSGPTVAETFGRYLLLLGPVVSSSLNRHLQGEAPDAEAAPAQQTVVFSHGVDTRGLSVSPTVSMGRFEASKVQSGGNGSWTGADIDLAEQGESLSQLRMRMTERTGSPPIASLQF